MSVARLHANQNKIPTKFADIEELRVECGLPKNDKLIALMKREAMAIEMGLDKERALANFMWFAKFESTFNAVELKCNPVLQVVDEDGEYWK